VDYQIFTVLLEHNIISIESVTQLAASVSARIFEELKRRLDGHAVEADLRRPRG
jgi:hypothetical protein